MNSLVIIETDHTPSVVLDKDAGIFEIAHRSLPENAIDFFDPIINWIKEYAKNPNKITEFSFKLEYYNTATSKQIAKLLLILEELNSNHKSEVKIIGNLPYYISSPILFKMLAWQNWERMVLMFQKELAQRIVSKHGNKSYGRISVMCQVYCDVNIEFMVSKNVFRPKPEVDSAVLTFFPKNNDLPDFSAFSKLVKQAFSQRRKKLKNNLPEAYKLGKIEKWADSRPEEISPDEFIQIYNVIFVG